MQRQRKTSAYSIKLSGRGEKLKRSRKTSKMSSGVSMIEPKHLPLVPRRKAGTLRAISSLFGVQKSFRRRGVSNSSQKKLNTFSTYTARRDSVDCLTGNQLNILMSGGKQIRKGGYLRVRVEGNPERDKIVYLKDGTIIISDENDNIELVLNIVELTEIKYKTLKSATFQLEFRGLTFPKEKERASPNRDSGFLKGRLSRMSINSWTSKASNLLFPSSVTNVLRFTAVSHDEACEWVQAILYEVRNQAVFVDRSIKARKDGIVPIKKYQLDPLYRQSVDLWSLAKGKYSAQALSSMESLATFLAEMEDEEENLWNDILKYAEEVGRNQKRNTNTSVLDVLRSYNNPMHHENLETDEYKPIKREVLLEEVTGVRKSLIPLRNITSAREIKEQRDREGAAELLNTIQRNNSSYNSNQMAI